MVIPLILLGGGAALGYWFTRTHPTHSKQPLEPEPTDSATPQSTPERPDPPRFRFQQLLLDLKSMVQGGEQQQHLETLAQKGDHSHSGQASSGALLPESHKKDFAITLGTVVAALLGGPVFSTLSVAGIFYLSRDIIRFMLSDFRKGRILNVFLVDQIVIIGMILSGQLLLAALAGLVGSFVVKLIKKTEYNSQQQLISVFRHHPNRVWVLQDGIEIEVAFAQLQVGDIVVVNAGEVIPVDGIIQAGYAAIDQHILTGESQPVERGPGDQVLASTLLLSGKISIQVETTGDETVAAQIGNVLNTTQEYKDTLVIRGKNIADRWLPIEFTLSAITLVLKGHSAAITVLWSSFGGNMVSLGPLSVLSYLQIYSRNGILIKDGRVLELLRHVDTVVFDKTGTLTLEQPTVDTIHCLGDLSEEILLRYAATAEYRQPHPIGKAIVAKAEQMNLSPYEIDTAHYEVGYGIKVQVHGKTIQVGSARFMTREGIELPPPVADIQAQAEHCGHSLIYVAIDRQLSGILALRPTLRPEAVQVIEYLKQQNKAIYIISGDHEDATRAIAQSLGIDHYFAGVLPENKAQLVQQLRDQGRFVCFVGDGINDAIALKTAHVSVSLKGASTAATDTAQIIFMDGTLNHIQPLFELSKEFERTMFTNLLTTIVPGVICVGGVYLLHFTIPVGMGLYFLGTAAGLTSALLPIIAHQHQHQHQHDRTDQSEPAEPAKSTQPS